MVFFRMAMCTQYQIPGIIGWPSGYPGGAQYPGGPGVEFPGGQFPGGQYPGAPGGQFPGAPGGGGQFPVGPDAGGQFPGEPGAGGQFPGAPGAGAGIAEGPSSGSESSPSGDAVVTDVEVKPEVKPAPPIAGIR